VCIVVDKWSGITLSSVVHFEWYQVRLRFDWFILLSFNLVFYLFFNLFLKRSVFGWKPVLIDIKDLGKISVGSFVKCLLFACKSDLCIFRLVSLTVDQFIKGLSDGILEVKFMLVVVSDVSFLGIICERRFRLRGVQTTSI